jgi:hypothetical protein
VTHLTAQCVVVSLTCLLFSIVLLAKHCACRWRPVVYELVTCAQFHVNQVKVGVHEFADGRPHYAWLPLAGRAAAGSVGGEVSTSVLRGRRLKRPLCCCAPCSVPWLTSMLCCRYTCACNGGRTSAKQMLRPRPSSRLRCSIARGHANPAVQHTTCCHRTIVQATSPKGDVLAELQVDLQGIGVSVIEASVTKLAREVMHVQLRRVRALPCPCHASEQSLGMPWALKLPVHTGGWPL